MRITLAAAAVAVSFSAAQAADWSGLVGSAQRIYYVPLDAAAYPATLEVSGKTPMDRDTKLDETLAEAALFAEFNSKALAALRARLGEKVQPVPERFRVEKKVLFAKVWTTDWEALDCDFYVLAKIEPPGVPRGAHYRVSRIDLKDRASHIALMPAPVSLTLYHKPKPSHKGKRVVSAEAALLGSHSFQIVQGKSAAEVIEETVEADLAGREPEDPVETFHFAWSSKHYADRPGDLETGFTRHAGRLRARFRARLFSVIDAFITALDKKLG